MINRCAVIIRPGQPYIDWAAGLDDSGVLPDPDGEPAIYLIPDYDADAEAWELLSDCYDVIFEAELEGWHTVESDWPSGRTLAMFREWFEITLSSGVEDLCEGDIVDDEDDA